MNTSERRLARTQQQLQAVEADLNVTLVALEEADHRTQGQLQQKEAELAETHSSLACVQKAKEKLERDLVSCGRIGTSPPPHG